MPVTLTDGHHETRWLARTSITPEWFSPATRAHEPRDNKIEFSHVDILVELSSRRWRIEISDFFLLAGLKLNDQPTYPWVTWISSKRWWIACYPQLVLH